MDFRRALDIHGFALSLEELQKLIETLPEQPTNYELHIISFREWPGPKHEPPRGGEWGNQSGLPVPSNRGKVIEPYCDIAGKYDPGHITSRHKQTSRSSQRNILRVLKEQAASSRQKRSLGVTQEMDQDRPYSY